MARTNTNTNSQMDPKSGFCSHTKIFGSLRPSISLPPPSQPLSATQFVLSLLHSTATTNFSETPFLINDVATDASVTYSEFVYQTKSLAISLQKQYSLSKGDVAFILSPNSIHIPILYFSLLSLGVIIAPANPDDSISELTHQIQLSRPIIAFATLRYSHKLPPTLRTVLIDSPEFSSLLTQYSNINCDLDKIRSHVVNQSDIAAIVYSSGTTGRNKGVLLTHGNLIARIAASHALDPFEHGVKQRASLLRRPLFGSYCIIYLMRAASMGETLVLTGASDLETVLKAAEKYKLNYCSVPVSFIVAMVKLELTNYDLSSLRFLLSGGAPLGEEVSANFREKFPNVEILDAYGLTEAGPVAAMRSPDEKNQLGSVGRLTELVEAKIVDPLTGEILSPGQRGELWVRGPTIMKGYVGDEKETADALDSEGWLKTGDLCFFDSDGFLFIVDRLKEIIKYNGNQVAPAELEHLLLSNPDIGDAAVVPYPDEEAGQIPMAFVVRKPGTTITEAQVMDFIAKQVAPQKKIRRVTFIDSIPKSSAGKILRRELVNRALSNC
ncbi:hypothetical protein JRO89_XS01G0172500 [Xanthoceras sorbifolium]|uniref:4-coumarate--CoA ligase n=1 Tax=Xanthoceras sorbifolium TaxID=99658 RepID=A0ABQ8IKB1_9ROSI|nr:hypothetical protein JRO89_XS01G0172500 [Xanthoceras sorbifolium]